MTLFLKPTKNHRWTNIHKNHAKAPAKFMFLRSQTALFRPMVAIVPLSKYEKGVDGEFSLDPIEFKSLVEESRVAWQSIGKIKYGPVDNEKNYLQYRRSLYVTQDMRKGEKFTKKNLKSIRPGLGLPVQNYEIIIGRKSSKAIKAGTALSWKLVN